jgi:hypothetical protein
MKRLHATLIPTSTGLCLCACLLTNNAKANFLFDANGATSGFGIVNGGSYSWDDANWTTSATGVTATSPWTSFEQQFARIGGTANAAYTITVGADEQMAGLFNTQSTGTLTINAIGIGTLDVVTNGGSLVSGGFVQGFLGSGGTTVINAPISGVGGVSPSNGGTLDLFGNNTYTGGTSFTSSSTLVNFNNNNSFSTGTMTLGEASGSFAPLLGQGGHTITLANNFVNSTSGGGVNFAAVANTPVISTGTWSLGANNLNLRNNANASSPVTLTGVISGSANLTLSSANGGRIKFSGANTYTGVTTIGMASATAVTLELDAANTIASSSKIVMAGGTLDFGGFNHSMGSTTLGMTSGSTMYFEGSGQTVSFANSSLVAWTGVLNLADWNPDVDTLQIGTDGTGITAAQLSEIEAWGDASTLGTATINSLGDVIVPEPSTNVLFALGGLGIVVGSIIRRRRTA